MANQSATTSKSSELSRNEPFENKPTNFKWTEKVEKCLLKNMLTLKPVGINKHLNMLLICENMNKELKMNITTKYLWDYVDSKWDIPTIDKMQKIPFNVDVKPFDLPEEYDSLVAKAFEKIKKSQEKEGLNDENIKKKLIGPNKTRSKSNSMSSVDSKDGFIETVPKLTDETVVKTNEVKSDEVLGSRRSLRTYDRMDLKELVDKLIEKKRLLSLDHSFGDFKQSNTKRLNQSIDLDKNKQGSNTKGPKRKSRNVSESSSLNSDNIKQPRLSRSNVTDLNVSDGSSRSVTPEILKGKSNRSVTPEMINRKSNLRSGDKEQKNKSSVEKPSNKPGPSSSEVKNDQSKLEKSPKIMLKKVANETTSKTKNKTRLTADYLVVQQSPELQSLGRRSFNKN